MKITKVDVMLIEPKAEDNPAWSPVGCRIYTDQGIYGDGEVALAFGSASTAAYGALIDFSQKIIGKDPLENEVIWEELYKSTFWGQNGGPVVFGAISAIDIALWDIKAKFFKVPLYKLLGGKIHKKLRTYASQLQFGWGEKKLGLSKTEDYATVVKKAVSEGYTAIKIDFFTFDENGKRFTHTDTNCLQSAKNINLKIEKGEVVGIIGYNGAGKSTLLKIISRIVEPTEGKVTVKGKIAPLIELGAGFDFELTARENVFLNGLILGYSKSFIKKNFDKIIDFAEIENEFLDVPLKKFSSGMIARLGFAISTVIKPDILIVDEILSVGDFKFQEKSLNKIKEMMENDTTVIMVSHSIEQIEKMCTKVVWLENGSIKKIGNSKEICEEYKNS